MAGFLSSIGSATAEIGRSMRSSFRSADSAGERDDMEEVELQWAAIERLPTFERMRSSLVESYGGGKKQVDVTKLGAMERRIFIDNLMKDVHVDNRRLLEKLRERMNKVDIQPATIEVRYKNLSVEAHCEAIDGNLLPTLWNSIKGALKGFINVCNLKPRKGKTSIINDVSGVIKPSRMTLLLGPPGCGKTTLLLALAEKLGQPLEVTGEISYNGFKLEEFVPEKTSAYISQYDLHIPEMSVRETLDFAARCQGVGSRANIMMELSRREKQAGIIPDSTIDTYMKAISAVGLQGSLQTDYILKILGLDICSDIMIGDAMKRGISGGQKKRLTTGEMIIGPTKVLFMDEISTGLDSSTTFQIISCIQQLVHIMEVTALISLLQPAPETFDLFDDIILMAEGRIIYHGPLDHVIGFFDDCGFRCPQRKDVADFLQEVMSEKDQAQYWHHSDKPYSYVTAEEFTKKFQAINIGKKLNEELSKPCEKSDTHKAALSFNVYSLTKWELFKTCMAREFLLMKRNSFIHAFKTVQLVIIAVVSMTVFLRTKMAVDLVHANYYIGSLDYTIIRLMTNGLAELMLSVSRLPVFYKQRDAKFYPAWAYSIPAFILKIPFSLVESFIWTALTYYVIGYSPEAKRFFCHFFILFELHQTATSLFRFLASLAQTQFVASSAGTLSILICCLFGGFILPRTSLPTWLRWGVWFSPITYAEIGISINEFHAPRWQKISQGNTTLGKQVLRSRGLDFEDYYYWLSVAGLIGLTLLFNIGFTMLLAYLKDPGTSQATTSRKQLSLTWNEDSNIAGKSGNMSNKAPSEDDAQKKGKVVLPFVPLCITFQDVQYFIDVPQEMKRQGFNQERLQLLQNMTGAFRPRILTALMGVSGAGKTTLMDVLCGRKTSGVIEGDIRIGGYPKVQKTFARISGYCEQTDTHSPQVTVEESVIYSAWLRLPPEIDQHTKAEFVEEALQIIELDRIKDALVGVPGVSGLSTEQRKRLSIAVELVANPSIMFMDEPTSGLDARAAAIVLRAVRNIANTGRTLVCTIHQPSINIFESFDELLLMKRGGQIIYSGPLDQNSSKLIEYFQGISGVPKIRDYCNPATWMLEVTSTSMEQKLGVDFANIYRDSSLYLENKRLIEQLSIPPAGSADLHFETHFPQNGWEQFKACLWKQFLSYWRSPTYNLARFIFLSISSVLFATLICQQGKKINDVEDLFNIFGSMYLAVIFLGAHNCTGVLPIIARERAVLYRERFAGMYSSWAYSSAQVIIEIPYLFLLAATFLTITYPAIGYYWSAYKAFWYFYAIFCSLLSFNYLGMLVLSVSPNIQVATISAGALYTLLNLFSGFLIPRPRIPKWWVWLYWISPTSWSLKGLLTSQYGDITLEVAAFGKSVRIDDFLKDYYGFHHDQLGLVALVLACFPIVFASMFGYFIGKLNFQRR